MAANGGLTKTQHDCLKVHLARMIRAMDVGSVLDEMAQAGVVNPYAKRELLEMDQHEQAFELFALIKRQGSLAFDVFHDALEVTGHKEFVNLIRNETEQHFVDDDNNQTDWHVFRKSSFRSNSFKKEKPSTSKLNETTIDDDKEFKMKMSLENLQLPSRSSMVNENFVTSAKLVASSSAFPSDVYHMTSSPKGNVLIINNITFNTMPNRDGSCTDEDNLRKLFTFLDYRVHVHKNLTAAEMYEQMRRFASLDDHRNRSSAMVVVLSHGEAGVLYGIDDGVVCEHRFIMLLNAANAPLLAGKPKVFLMQACRGEGKDRGFAARDEADGNVPSTAAPPGLERAMRAHNDGVYTKVPLEADILICRSTPIGYVSWRNSRDGTWFIQAVCDVFKECAQEDEIIELFTKVNRHVSSKFESSRERCKQISEISTRLRKKLYFFPPRKSDTLV
ncbi:hypothetical protein L596_026342 [Steinernema carpocapsae]|nr:hypothetical protein L596_026342 [Steinernema carpocapsae]